MKLKSILAVFAVTLCLSAVGIAQEKDPPRQSLPEIDSAKDYLLGPGDVLEVKIFGIDLQSTAHVDGQGYIRSLPFLERPIIAKCRTEYEIQGDIATAYKVIINDPQVSVRLIERNRSPASVFGAVRQPVRVPMQKSMRLNEVIAASGGITERAAGTIQILHTEPLLCPAPGEEAQALPIDGTRIPLQVVQIAEMKSGILAANPLIRAGDYVSVTEAELVYITGSVVSPGSQLLTDKLSLSRVLAMSGGARREANLSDVRIYRQNLGSLQQEVLRVNYQAIKKNEAPDVLLKAYDVIEVREQGISVRTVLRSGLAEAFRRPVLPLVP